MGSSKLYIAANKAKQRGYHQKWRESEKGKLYKATHKESNRRVHKRRWDALVARDGEYCRQCETTDRLTVNHVIPVCVGGTDDLHNLEILCLHCNIKEYHRLVQLALKAYFETTQEG